MRRNDGRIIRTKCVVTKLFLYANAIACNIQPADVTMTLRVSHTVVKCALLRDLTHMNIDLTVGIHINQITHAHVTINWMFSLDKFSQNISFFALEENFVR